MAPHREPLTGVDAAWLRMDRPTNRMIITSVLMFDDLLPLDDLRRLIEERFLIFQRFKQRVVNPQSNPHWEDDPYFDLNRHLHRMALPEPGTQRELEALVSDLMNAPLDLSKPPWEMHLVENYRNGCALVIRLHHCIADGIALMHVLLSMADEHFDPTKATPVRRRAEEAGLLSDLVGPVINRVRRTVAATGTVLHEGMDMLLNPALLFERAKQSMSIGAATSKLALMRSDSDTVFKGQLGVTKHAAWSRPVPLPLAKEIAHRVEGKINDVLLTAVTGALRRYLLTHNELVDDVNIRAAIPVNLRPLDEAHHLGNQFGLVFLALPVGIANPRERLLELKRRMDRIKYSMEAPVTLGILHLIGNAPHEVENQVVNLLSKKASAVMTNVPGPREELHFKGRRLRHVMFWVPRAGDVSLGVSILSYAGEVLLGIATDMHLIPDPVTIVTAFHKEFEALYEELT